MFYAKYCSLGNVVDSDGFPYGTVYAFKTKKECRDWVDLDSFDGNWHRFSIPASEARRMMLPEVRELAGANGIPASEISFWTMQEVYDWYESAIKYRD